MHTEIVKQINELPISERVKIIEEVSRSVRQDLLDHENKITDDEKRRLRSEAIKRLRGIASIPGKRPPTDEEWREGRTQYLLEKHK